MLRIADVEFAVVNCYLKAYCDTDRMKWDLEVECARHEAPDFHRWEPTLSLCLFETPPDAFRHWTELAPREVRWIEKNDTDVTPSGSLYVFEHTPVFDCHVRYYSEAGSMHIELNGKCDIYFDQSYDTNLDLHLDSGVAFQGVWFGRRPESECRSEIARFLNPKDFKFSPTEHGVSVLTPK
jgi:hypothetical protein